jgi:CheY-like chemotaxis protein
VRLREAIDQALGRGDATAANQSPAGGLAKLSMKVLLVEDSPVNREVARRMLESLGCTVETASDGSIGVEEALSYQYDVVLMDCQMPLVDGFEATSRIRVAETANGRAGMPIIALTANALQGDRERCLAAGMTDFISKPFTIKKLHAALTAAATGKPVFEVAPPNPRIAERPAPPPQPSLELDEAPVLDTRQIDELRALKKPGLLEQAIAMFQKQASATLDEVDRALRASQAAELEQHFHALKSCSLSIGARRFASVASDCEQAVRNGDLVAAERFATNLPTAVRRAVRGPGGHCAGYEEGGMSDRPARILYADDDAAALIMAQAALEAGGYEVTSASDGTSALELFAKQRPDCLILDIMMPGKNGYEVCRAVRALPGAKDIPILILTSRDDVESVARAYDSGATDFATKGISSRLLVERIRFLLREHQFRRALEVSRSRLHTVQNMARIGHWEVDGAGKTLHMASLVQSLLYEVPPTEGNFGHLVTAVRTADSRRVLNAFVEWQKTGKGFPPGSAVARGVVPAHPGHDDAREFRQEPDADTRGAGHHGVAASAARGASARQFRFADGLAKSPAFPRHGRGADAGGQPRAAVRAVLLPVARCRAAAAIYGSRRERFRVRQGGAADRHRDRPRLCRRLRAPRQRRIRAVPPGMRHAGGGGRNRRGSHPRFLLADERRGMDGELPRQRRHRAFPAGRRRGQCAAGKGPCDGRGRRVGDAIWPQVLHRGHSRPRAALDADGVGAARRVGAG